MFFLPGWFFYCSCIGFSITNKSTLPIKLAFRRGIFSVSRYPKNKDFSFAVPSFTNKVQDAVGAGDAMLSYATLCMLESKSLVLSSILGSIAAACECEVEGNIEIKPQKIIEKIVQIEESINYKILDKT